MSSQVNKRIIQWEEYLLGGMGAVCAGVFTNPLEVIKTRIQLQGELQTRGQYTVHYRNVFHAIYAVAKAESFVSLQKGLVPALWYQFIMNGIRFGSYQVFDNNGFIRNDQGNVIVYRSVIASILSGGLGTLLSNPLFLLKTQLQSSSSAHIAVGHQHGHTSMTSGFKVIYSGQGVYGLWRGSTAAILRCAVGGSVQLTSFTAMKACINKSGYFPPDSWYNTLISSFVGGILLSTFSSPLDVVTTRLFNQPIHPTGKGQLYTGVLDCMLKIGKTEGPLALYKGFTVSFLRLGPHTMLSILFWQLLRKQYFSFINENQQINQSKPGINDKDKSHSCVYKEVDNRKEHKVNKFPNVG